MVPFERPIFIVAAPRSGSTMVFEALSRAPGLWTIGGEAHDEFERVPGWHPREHNYDSNRLAAADASPDARAQLVAALARRLRNSDGLFWRGRGGAAAREPVRLLEKTPKNVLRVPLLKALFPDARFIFLARDPRANVSSMMEAWRSQQFVTYPDLPGWTGMPWSLLLPPGWRQLAGAPLERVAAFQWAAAINLALDDLEDLPEGDWCTVAYEQVVAEPRATFARLCDFAGVAAPDVVLDAMAALPPSRYTLTPPRPDKWLDNEAAIRAVIPELERCWTRLRARGAAL